MFKETQFFAFMDYETTGVDTSRGTKVRPIQIGIVFTDHKFTKIVEYNSLIKWDSIMDMSYRGECDWPKEFQGATRFMESHYGKYKRGDYGLIRSDEI